MINLMEIVALTAGILFSFYYYRRSADSILILIYFVLFNTKERFGRLYDLSDDETTYVFIGDRLEGVKKYSDYYRLHEDARRTSFKHFRRYYSSIKTLLLMKIMPIVLVPAILFWANWYFYVIGVMVSLIGLVAHKTLIKDCRAGFYQRLVIFAVIQDYQKSLKQKLK